MRGEWVRKGNGELAVVFIHGILSSGDTAWKHPNGTYWPHMLRDDTEAGDVGIYVFTYRADAFAGNYTLEDAADALNFHLKDDEVLARRKIVFVCHSMGGIVARRFVVARHAVLEEQNKTIGMFLVASPSMGSGYADFIHRLARWFGNTQLRALTSAAANLWLAQLDRDFMRIRDEARITVHGKELIEDQFYLGRWLYFFRQIVPAESGYRYFGEPARIPHTDHGSIAKPDSPRARQHRELVQFLAKTASYNTPRLYPIEPYVTEMVSNALLEATHSLTNFRPSAGQKMSYAEALELARDALIATRRYVTRSERGEYRDPITEDELSRLWERAGRALGQFDPNFSQLCHVKSQGWADESVWTDPRFKDLPIQLNDILARLTREAEPAA